MTNTIYGMTNYYNLFTSPLSTSQQDPTANFIYGASANSLYLKTFAKKFTSEMSSYLSSLNSGISDLKSAAKAFTSNAGNSSFNQKAVTASDSSAAGGTADSNAASAVYTLNTSKLAKAQQNVGTSLNSNLNSAFTQGTNTFSLKVGDQNEKDISFNVNANDTNKSVLYKMANSINYSNSGVTASVMNDSKTGTSLLKITSDKTGTDSAFTLTDKQGNAASLSGANLSAVQAQNAEYTLDGKKYTSQDNNITLDDGKVQITLNKADNKDVKLSVGVDTNSIKSGIRDFVAGYNNTINLTNSYSSDFSGAGALKSELSSIVNSKDSSLESIGITKNSDGTLGIDENKLDKALKENIGQVKDVFSGTNGIADKIYLKSNEVLNSPAKYSSPAVISNSSNTLYGNSSSLQSGFASAQNTYRGMIVDMLL